MFQYLPEHSGNLVAITTSGILNNDDLNKLLPEVEEKIKRYGKVKFYWEMNAFEGWNPLSFIRDRAFEIKHAADFKKIAMVGEKGWEEKLAGLMKPFTQAQLKYFDRLQRQEALNWIMED